MGSIKQTDRVKRIPPPFADESCLSPALNVIKAGNFQLDCDLKCVFINNKTIPLAPNEIRLLRYLLEARGRVVPRISLFQRITNPSRVRIPKLQSVDMHIKRLREKLGTDGKSIITVRNVGYRVEICPEWIDRAPIC